MMLTQTFKFKGFKAVLASLVFLNVFCVTLAILVLTSEGGGVLGACFCLGCAAVMSALGWLYVKGSSAIVVDEIGISRVFLRRRISFIAWRDIGLVTVFPLTSSGVRRGTTGYNVIPVNSRGLLDRRRKIYFSNQTTDPAGLLSAMNAFMSNQDIRIEIVSNGQATVVKSL